MGVGKGYLVRTFTDGLPKTLKFQGHLNSQGQSGCYTKKQWNKRLEPHREPLYSGNKNL